MIKLYIGGKGSGKTKTLIDLTNKAVETSNGAVICIEKGDKLRLDISYKARLIDTDNYAINDGDALYGFIAGILASNSDITDIFVDSSLKICDGDIAAFEILLNKLYAISGQINLIMTASIPIENCPASIKKFV